MKHLKITLTALAIATNVSAAFADTIRFDYFGRSTTTVGGSIRAAGFFEFNTVDLSNNIIVGEDILEFEFNILNGDTSLKTVFESQLIRSAEYSFAESNGLYRFKA